MNEFSMLLSVKMKPELRLDCILCTTCAVIGWPLSPHELSCAVIGWPLSPHELSCDVIGWKLSPPELL